MQKEKKSRSNRRKLKGHGYLRSFLMQCGQFNNSNGIRFTITIAVEILHNVAAMLVTLRNNRNRDPRTTTIVV